MSHPETVLPTLTNNVTHENSQPAVTEVNDKTLKETCNTVNKSSSKKTSDVICASCQKRITVRDSKMKTITCIHCNAPSEVARLKPAMTDVIPDIAVDVLPHPDKISKETCNTVNERSIKKTTDVICVSCEQKDNCM